MAAVDDALAERRQRKLGSEFRIPGAAPLPTDLLRPDEVYDQDLFDLEMLRVFARSWIWLGDTEDLVEPGDFITGKIGYQPVFVVRQDDGTLRGFFNACRHRASPVVAGPGGHCTKSFTCPYHNWTYAFDGTLIGVPDKRRMYGRDFPMHEYGLVPIRVGILFDKLVFGCISRKQVSLEEYVGPFLERYSRYGFQRFTRFHRDLDDTYPINWKAFMENSNDDIGYTCSGYKPAPEGFDATGGRTDLPEKDLRGFYADALYPNLSPLPNPTELWMVRADPVAPDRTRLFSRVYGLNKTIEEQEATLENLEFTNHEDTAMVTRVMENLRSPLYRVGPPSNWEGRALHIDRLIRRDVETPLAIDEFEGPVD
ncbi:MAG: aromatic ring-hydroxylating dioxygenase subunit alpha [Actinobacteria bacterium]|nr:MAG: aromatic ring-hydroxylating dioxygenase subunit alpha [Actinomycetota bacterium]